jgi:hypothetical protein
MCYLGSLCTNLVKADDGDEDEKTSIAKYVLSGAGLLATVAIFIYLMWYTKKMMRGLEDETLDAIELQKKSNNHHEIEVDKTPQKLVEELEHCDATDITIDGEEPYSHDSYKNFEL